MSAIIGLVLEISRTLRNTSQLKSMRRFAVSSFQRKRCRNHGNPLGCVRQRIGLGPGFSDQFNLEYVLHGGEDTTMPYLFSISSMICSRRRNAGQVVGIFASQQIESVNFRQKTFSL